MTKYKVIWLDSANMFSRIHITLDYGRTTLCGHQIAKEKNWRLIPEGPGKRGGYTNYCKVCFADIRKSISWLQI